MKWAECWRRSNGAEGQEGERGRGPLPRELKTIQQLVGGNGEWWCKAMQNSIDTCINGIWQFEEDGKTKKGKQLPGWNWWIMQRIEIPGSLKFTATAGGRSRWNGKKNNRQEGDRGRKCAAAATKRGKKLAEVWKMRRWREWLEMSEGVKWRCRYETAHRKNGLIICLCESRKDAD